MNDDEKNFVTKEEKEVISTFTSNFNLLLIQLISISIYYMYENEQNLYESENKNTFFHSNF